MTQSTATKINFSGVPSVSGGHSKHRIYQNFYLMHYRIKNAKHPSYERYKAKNIEVCDRWLDFNNFITDLDSTYKEGYVLDRIDNNGDYSPQNCEWVTRGWNAAKDLSTPINQYDLQGLFEKTFQSPEEAGRYYGVGANGFRRANKLLLPYKGKRWVALLDTSNLSPQYMSGTINNNGQAVLKYDMQGNFLHRYTSMREASEINNISDSSLSLAVNGYNNSAGDFRWCIEVDPNTGYDGVLHPLKKSKVTKEVIQYEVITTLKEINRFKTIKDAADSINLKGSNITAVCNGKKKSAGGFVWKRVDQVE